MVSGLNGHGGADSTMYAMAGLMCVAAGSPRRLARRRGAHIMTYLARVLSLPHMRLVNVYISRPARLVCLRVGVPLIGGRRLQEKYFEPLPPPAVEAAKEGKSE